MDSSIIMSRPVNGQNYDSFMFAQYFNVTVDGAAAPDEVTLAAIAAINALPDLVSLADKGLVAAARAAYDKIALLEQRALVYNYAKLQEAEKRIANLEYLENGDPAPEPTPEPTPDPMTTAEILCIVFGSLLVVSIAALIVLLVLLRKKNKGTPPSSPEEEDLPEGEAAEENDAESADAEVEDTPCEASDDEGEETPEDEPESTETTEQTDATAPSPADAGEAASENDNSEEKSDDPSERA
jgi:hypothetical protein